MGEYLKAAYMDKELYEDALRSSIGWRKLFEESQELLRKIRKESLLPNDLYVKAVKLCELEVLPKKYLKGGK